MAAQYESPLPVGEPREQSASRLVYRTRRAVEWPVVDLLANDAALLETE